MSTAETWTAIFRQRAAELPGARLNWLPGRRERAIERFAALGWPTSRLERWRHTSLALLDSLPLAPTSEALDPAQTLAGLRATLDAEEDGCWLVFVDGRHQPALSVSCALPAGVSLVSLAEALESPPPALGSEGLAAVFGEAEDNDSPHALNLALASDGAVLHLARGVSLDKVVHLVFLGGGSEASRHVRNLLIAEEGSSATLIEHHLGSQERRPQGAETASLSTVVTRVVVGAGARVSHIKLQQEDEYDIHLGLLEAEQAEGSSFSSHSLSFGARLSRHDIRTRFDGQNAEALLNGLYHVDGRRHVDHHTMLDHRQPRCVSHELYRGLIDDSGRGVFTGRIIVAQDAQHTDAVQRVDNLLLSARAEADARPELEIYADDVKCAHGATVGQIDEDSLFYLRSRGLDEVRARQLLTYAFAADVIDRVALQSVRRQARAVLFARLPGGALLEELL